MSSVHSKRGVKRINEGLLTDGLEQAIHRTFRQQPRSQCFISNGSDKNHRDVPAVDG